MNPENRSTDADTPDLAPVPDLLLATAFADPRARVDEILELPFERREKSRFRAVMLSGETIGVSMPPGTLLRHGTRLKLDDGRVVAVEAELETLLEVRAVDAQELARIAYHVGNRHVPLQIGESCLWLLPCLLYTSPSPRDRQKSRMPSSA